MDQTAKAEAKVIGPLAAIVALLGMLAIVALIGVTQQVDAQARLRQERLVETGLTTRVQELELAIASELAEPANESSVSQQDLFGRLNTSVGVASVQVLDNAEPTGLIAGAAPLVERLSQTASDPSRPLQASNFVSRGGQVHVVTATRVAAGAPIVVTDKILDGAFIEGFTSRYLLNQPELSLAPPMSGGVATSALSNMAGEQVAYLTWKPERPGSALLQRTLPFTSLAVFAFAACALMLFRRGRKAAHDLLVSEAKAKHMAFHDALTGLPNRVLFNDRLSAAVDHHRRGKGDVAVLCIDLDRFKDVNDSLGHQCGDELIVEAANRLKSVVRKTDTLARLGGDEFAIVMHESARGASSAASRILEKLNAPADLTGGRVFLAGSIGITVISERGVEGPEALRQADVALYRAKAAGRGQFFFFEPEMDAALKVRRALETDLREALADDALHMVYQPQVDRNGKIFGVEALVRWDHPIRGAVSPAYFVPIAEESGLIEQLSMFTIRQAFADSLQWPDLRVAVNISAKQISTPNFPEKLEDIIKETGADPKKIELEITEGLLLGDDQETHQTLTRLRSMGFSLALDDFGTGYSSLSYLRRYPIDQIKIDRSFVASLGVDAEAEDVVKAMIKLARALNLSIIAEGVETPEQHKRLAAVGCSRVQGFLYSRPVPAMAIAEMLSRGVLKAGA